MSPHRKFTFDTVFDGDGVVSYAATRPKRAFSPDEVEQVRNQAFAEGERSAVVRAEEAAAASLADIARSTRTALGALAHLAHEHRTACAELALACARTIAGAALERFPQAPAQAALQSLAREIEAAPKLAVRTAPDMVERLQAALDVTAQACGFPGQIVVKGDPALPDAAFVLDWGDGRAAFDPTQAAERVTDALHTALAAEGLHAEPLISLSEADHG
ncbi:MAG TPA: flagellar assembly protein FliH [Caulobacteraceae bacterium]